MADVKKRPCIVWRTGCALAESIHIAAYPKYDRGMNRSLTLVLALAAGILGGLASRYLTPVVVFAQTPTPAPKEIRAQSFVLVNAQGVPMGLMGTDPPGGPIIILKNENGTTIWSTKARLSIQGEESK